MKKAQYLQDQEYLNKVQNKKIIDPYQNTALTGSKQNLPRKIKNYQKR